MVSFLGPIGNATLNTIFCLSNFKNVPVNSTRQADSLSWTAALPVSSFRGLGYQGKSYKKEIKFIFKIGNSYHRLAKY